MIAIDYASVDGDKTPDFKALAKKGIGLAILRAEWGTTEDNTILRDYTPARQAGMLVGAYLYMRSDPHAPAPEEQVAQFLAQIKKLPTPLTFPVSLDVEYSGNGISDTGRTPTQALTWAHTAYCALRAGLGYPPMIYTSRRVWIEDLHNPPAPEGWTDSGLWLTHYETSARQPAILPAPDVVPGVPDPWGGAYWLTQYQGDATGLASSTVDVSVFHLLRAGERSPRVAQLQRLMLRGAEDGAGVFGDATLKAVHDFQTLKGLVSDGIVGAATYARLIMGT